MAGRVIYERGPNRLALAAPDVCLVDGDGALRATPQPSAAPLLRRRVDLAPPEGRHERGTPKHLMNATDAAATSSSTVRLER